MPAARRATFTNPTTPWGAAHLLNPDGDTALGASYGFSAYMRTLPAAGTALALKGLTHLDHVIDVRDYGAVGDGVTDDAAAIEAAIAAAMVTKACVEFPPGTYLINSTVTIGYPTVDLRGSSALGATIKAGAAMTYMFHFADLAFYAAFCLIENLFFDGNDLADTAVYGAMFQHNVFRRVTVRKTLVSGIKFRSGWCNDLVECEIGYNTGMGLDCLGGTPNVLNVQRCKIYHNDGWGAQIGGGYGLSFVGNTIEHNKAGGVLLYYARGGQIAGNEFSSNGENGTTTTSGYPPPPGGGTIPLPAGNFTYRTELFLNGYSSATSLSQNNPPIGLSITGNVFLPSYSESAIFAVSGTGLNIHGNHVLGGAAIPLLRVYRHRSFADLTDLTIGVNTMLYPAATFLADKGFVDNKAGLDDVHTWSLAGQARKNYLDTRQDLTKWVDAATVAGSSLTLSATKFMGMPVYELACSGATSSRFEVGLNINADYPELKSQLVWFGCWCYWDDPVDANLQLYCDVDAGAYYYSTDTAVAAPTGWQFISMMIAVPAADADFRVGLRKLGASTTPLYICNPILTRVGNRYDVFGSAQIAAHEGVYPHALIDTAVQDGSLIQSLDLGIAETPDGYWKMNDNAASTDVLDASGNGYTLTAQQNTSALTTAGAINTALEFDGAADYLVRADPTFNDLTGTIVAWIYRADDLAGGCIFGSANEAGASYYIEFGYVGTLRLLRWYQRNADAVDELRAAVELRSGEWHQVAISSDGSTIRMYADGEPLTVTVQQGANNGDWLGDTNKRDNITIGAWKRNALSDYFKGAIDDVRYYSECLTAAQIQYLFRIRSETSTAIVTYDGGLLSLGANDSGGAGYRLLRVPNA